MHMYSNPLPCYLMNSQMRCLGRVVFNRCSHKWSLHGKFMILRCTHLCCPLRNSADCVTLLTATPMGCIGLRRWDC